MNKQEPLVMCLTNFVAQDITANVLLAVGAKPAMVDDPTEARELAQVADAALLNLGTLNESQSGVMMSALPMPCKWVLDPVAVHLLSYRREVMKLMMARQMPAAIRGNATEIDYLRNNFASLVGPVPTLATGEVDTIYLPGEAPIEMVGGVEMLTRVTATGCAQGALVAALLGRGQTPADALRWASRLMKSAGERAWQRAKAPGSFRAALVDAIYELGQEIC